MIPTSVKPTKISGTPRRRVHQAPRSPSRSWTPPTKQQMGVSTARSRPVPLCEGSDVLGRWRQGRACRPRLSRASTSVRLRTPGTLCGSASRCSCVMAPLCWPCGARTRKLACRHSASNTDLVLARWLSRGGIYAGQSRVYLRPHQPVATLVATSCRLASPTDRSLLHVVAQPSQERNSPSTVMCA